MDRFITTSLCVSPLGGRTLRLYRKLRYLITILRTFPHLAKTPALSLDLRSCSLLSSRLPPSSVRAGVPKSSKLKHGDISHTAEHFLGSRGVKYPQAVRFYSTPSRSPLKAEAPIGLYQDSQTAFQLSLVHLGESFNRLSRHINVYFKRKDASISPVAVNAGVVVSSPESPRLSRPQRRAQSNTRAARARVTEDKESTTTTLKCEEKLETPAGLSETSAPQAFPGVQLFHISSIATRFGESYNYVAQHINSVFSKGPAHPDQVEDDLVSHRGSTRRHRRRTAIQRSHVENLKGDKQAQLKTCAAPVLNPGAESGDVSNNWEEGYLHFANHVNRYFGAKVSDEADLPPHQRKRLVVEHMPNDRTYNKQFSTHSTSKPESSPPDLKQGEKPLQPKSPGLFHISSLTTSFGESYAHMANHVNRYFNGSQVALEEEMEMEMENRENDIQNESAALQKPKPVFFMECLLQPRTAIPRLLGGYLKVGPWAQNTQANPTTKPSEASFNRRVIMSRRHAEEMTRALVGTLGQALTPHNLAACVEELNGHLIQHPACKVVVWQEKAAVKLLRQRRRHRDDQDVQSIIREALALIGYVDPVKGRGVRILSIDGGGTRGLVPLQVLKQLEAETGKQIHELFDYICGVSTGAVLAFMLGLARFSLDECADMYRRFGSDVFRQNPLVGTVKMGWSHSYYSTETWETILREKMGEKVLIKTARDELSPKVSAVSAVVNWGTSPKAFIFRNYNHNPGRLTRYAGGSGYQMWQALRASSAAPGYFQEYPLHSDIHQDGGIILNNPCALAVHESRLLWPSEPFQCVLSLGTGRYDNAKRGPTTSTSLRAKISTLICSATDTEAVHTLLDDLLPPDVYFRFNPMLSAEVSLDESRTWALDQMQTDTKHYLDRNGSKLSRLCKVLGAERTARSRTQDWVSERAWEMQQRWV